MHQRAATLSNRWDTVRAGLVPALGFACLKVLSDLSFDRGLQALAPPPSVPALSLYPLSSLPACIMAAALVLVARRRPRLHAASLALACALPLFAVNLFALCITGRALPLMPAAIPLGIVCGAASLGGKIGWLTHMAPLAARCSLVSLALGMALGTIATTVLSLLPGTAVRFALCAISLASATLASLARRTDRSSTRISATPCLPAHRTSWGHSSPSSPASSSSACSVPRRSATRCPLGTPRCCAGF